MHLANYKEMMLLPECETIINETIEIKGLKYHLLSLTQEAEARKLWMLHENSELRIEKSKFLFAEAQLTHRDELLHAIEREMTSRNLSIKEIRLQGQRFTVSRSATDYIDENNPFSLLKLVHFFEKELIPDYFCHNEFESLCLSSYEQREDEVYPTIDREKPLDIELLFHNSSKTYSYHDKLTVSMDLIDTNEEHMIIHPETNARIPYYLQELEVFDVNQFVKEIVSSEEYQEIEEVQRIELAGEMERSLNSICPLGMKIFLLKYEIAQPYSLNFYATSYLNKKVETSHQASSIGLLFSSESSHGPHQLPIKVCQIMVSDELLLNGTEFEIELMSFSEICIIDSNF